MSKRLYRSHTDRMFGGVCGGLGQYFEVDPSFVRLIFVLLTIFQGSGVLLYFILLIVLPDESRVNSLSSRQDVTDQNRPDPSA